MAWRVASAQYEATFDRIARIRIARRRCVARRHQTVDELLVVGSELQLQRFDIAVPVRLGAGARNGGADEPVLEDPGEREGDRGRAALCGMRGHLLRDRQRLRTPFGLLDPLVAASCARIGRRRPSSAYLPVSTPRASGLYGTTPRP